MHGHIWGIVREVLKVLAEASFGDGSRGGAVGWPICFQRILDFGLLFKKPDVTA